MSFIAIFWDAKLLPGFQEHMFDSNCDVAPYWVPWRWMMGLGPQIAPKELSPLFGWKFEVLIMRISTYKSAGTMMGEQNLQKPRLARFFLKALLLGPKKSRSEVACFSQHNILPMAFLWLVSGTKMYITYKCIYIHKYNYNIYIWYTVYIANISYAELNYFKTFW